MKPKLMQETVVYDADLSAAPLSVERRTVLENIPEGSRVLELGGSTGYFAELLRSRGSDVTAVELDPRAARRAEARGGRVITGDIEDPAVFERLDGPYDVILAMHVLEHLADPWRVLRGLRPLLAPKGRLLVLLPNIAAWRIRKDLFFKGAFEYSDVGILDRTHLRFFNLETGRRLLEDCGYHIDAWSSTDVCVPLERRMSLVPGLRGLSRAWHRWMSRRFPNLCSETFFFRGSVLG